MSLVNRVFGVSFMCLLLRLTYVDVKSQILHVAYYAFRALLVLRAPPWPVNGRSSLSSLLESGPPGKLPLRSLESWRLGLKWMSEYLSMREKALFSMGTCEPHVGISLCFWWCAGMCRTYYSRRIVCFMFWLGLFLDHFFSSLANVSTCTDIDISWAEYSHDC